ncbi:hypothetical protein C0Q70_17095 [Pomacea canaliculata]|uniref:C-type lectin domain-containing protein n=1 Tax=Pomacea canaliculata TaxID=400727 RepID=A0A2T7NRL7_POMCA|nr:hypothetical protein C0Q70_17095 [Pomacea canaliculata]
MGLQENTTGCSFLQASELPHMSMQQIQQLCVNEQAGTRDYFRHYMDVAQANGLKLVMYEGGPSVMEEGAIVSGANVQAVTDKAIAFNRDDAIRRPVQEQLNIWLDVVTNNARNNKPGGLFNYFSSTGTASKYGSWGMAEYTGQDLATVTQVAGCTELHFRQNLPSLGQNEADHVTLDGVDPAKGKLYPESQTGEPSLPTTYMTSDPGTGQSASQTTESCGSDWVLLNSSCYQLSLEPKNWFSALASCQEKDADLVSLESWTEQLDIDSRNSCDTNWIMILDSCYKIYNEAKPWIAAQRSCNEDGANLLTLESLDELVRNEMRRINSQTHWWVGLQKISDGKWQWFGKPPMLSPAVTQWKKDVLITEDCLVMDSDGFLSGMPYNCESEWINRFPSCYKLSSKTMSWSGAQDSCKAEGTNLLIVRTLSQLIKIQNDIDMKTSPCWVGVRRTSPSNEELKQDKVSQKCGMITSNNSLVFTDCTAFHSYICQKTRTSQKSRSGSKRNTSPQASQNTVENPPKVIH